MRSLLGLPVTIRVEPINHHGPYFAAVSRQVRLSVAFKIQSPDHPPIGNRRLSYGSANGLTAPLNIARRAGIYRNETRHSTILPHALEKTQSEWAAPDSIPDAEALRHFANILESCGFFRYCPDLPRKYIPALTRLSCLCPDAIRRSHPDLVISQQFRRTYPHATNWV